MKFFLLLFIFSSTLFATTIEFTDVTYTLTPMKNINKQKSFYQISSKFHLNRVIKKETIKLLLNRRQYMLDNNYYLDGEFTSKGCKLAYKKAYILGGKVHLLGVKGVINNQEVEAKEVIFDGYKKFILKQCEVKSKNKIYRRREFVVEV